jgi:hypothetical protein
MESDKVTADGIEVTGYPDLARKYQVSSVPKTVVGERLELFDAPSGRLLEFVGAAPEATLLKHVQDAAGTRGLTV